MERDREIARHVSGVHVNATDLDTAARGEIGITTLQTFVEWYIAVRIVRVGLTRKLHRLKQRRICCSYSQPQVWKIHLETPHDPDHCRTA